MKAFFHRCSGGLLGCSSKCETVICFLCSSCSVCQLDSITHFSLFGSINMILDVAGLFGD